MTRDRQPDDMARRMGTAAAGPERQASVAERQQSEAAARAPQDRIDADDRPMPIFAGSESDGYRTQWDGIQTGFVDEPRLAVEQADALVRQVIDRLSLVFSDERGALEKQWDRGDQVSTEDLRVSMRRYRSFFERLLSL